MNIFYEVGETFLVWLKVWTYIACWIGAASVIGYFLLKNSRAKIAEWLTSLIK